MNNIPRLTICSWSALGFIRGLNSYDYNYSNNKLYKHHEKAKQPFYFDKLVWGFAATFAYINPGILPFVLYKEIYRLEVNLRGLEDEKKTDYYNEVIFKNAKT